MLAREVTVQPGSSNAGFQKYLASARKMETVILLDVQKNPRNSPLGEFVVALVVLAKSCLSTPPGTPNISLLETLAPQHIDARHHSTIANCLLACQFPPKADPPLADNHSCTSPGESDIKIGNACPKCNERGFCVPRASRSRGVLNGCAAVSGVDTVWLFD
jgi:hypothetical protein